MFVCRRCVCFHRSAAAVAAGRAQSLVVGYLRRGGGGGNLDLSIARERLETNTRSAGGQTLLTVWKKVAIDLLELFRSQVTRRTILEETLVPGLDFSIGEFGVLAQVLQNFGLQFTVLLAHLDA